MDGTLLPNEDLFDNELLSKIDLVDYDIDRTYFRVCKYMKKYRRLKSKHFHDIPIKVTTNYKFIYVDEGTRSNNEYTQIDEYIDKDTEYRRMSKDICLITETLSQEELVYYTLCLYQQRSETRAFKEIGCSNTGLVAIKNSCIVKFASALNIEIYIDNGFKDKEEELEYQQFLELIKM